MRCWIFFSGVCRICMSIKRNEMSYIYKLEAWSAVKQTILKK